MFRKSKFRRTEYNQSNFHEFRDTFRVYKKPLQQKPIIKFSIYSIAMNLISTGPMFIPGVFLLSGWDLSLFLIIFVSIINFVTTEFLVETLSIMNAIQNLPEHPQSDREIVNEEDERSEILLEAIVQSVEKANDLELSERDVVFSLQSQFQYTDIAAFLWGWFGNIIVTLTVIFYLIGKMISQSIGVGQILSKMFQDTIILNSYYFWICLFYVMVLGLTFMKPNQIVPTTILSLRFFCIFLMIGASIYIAIDEGGFDIFKVDGFANFTIPQFDQIFSSIVYSFLIHHNIPSVVTPLRPEKKIKKSVFLAYLISTSVQILVPIAGGFAFGKQMNTTDDFEYKFFIYNFQDDLKWVYYFLTIFVVFSVLSYANHLNTLKNNMMRVFVPDQIPKQGFNTASILFSVLPLTFIVLVSGVYENIVTVIKITGGIFGVCVMMIFPALFVISSRRKMLSMFINYKRNFHRSYFSARWLPYFILLLSLLILAINLDSIFRHS